MDKIIDVPTLQLDKLTIANLGFLAQRRLARGVRLNHAEAVVCLFILSGLLYRAPSLIFFWGGLDLRRLARGTNLLFLSCDACDAPN